VECGDDVGERAHRRRERRVEQDDGRRLRAVRGGARDAALVAVGPVLAVDVPEQHRLAELGAHGEGRVVVRSVGRTEPAHRGPACASDCVRAGSDLAALLGTIERREPGVRHGVISQLHPGVGERADDLRMRRRLGAEKEERRWDVEPLELGEERGRHDGIGAVVEGERGEPPCRR
jgi:hypothetical protein